jgi:co-chaperonin GroES (HSP10)
MEEVMIAVPIGARCLVEDLEPEVSLVKRAAKAGLHLVIGEENVPKPTSGKVVAVGSDPLIQELVKLGDVVTFARHAGVYQQIEGKEFRCLELREIIMVIKPKAESQSIQQEPAPAEPEGPPAKDSLTTEPPHRPEN